MEEGAVLRKCTALNNTLLSYKLDDEQRRFIRIEPFGKMINVRYLTDKLTGAQLDAVSLVMRELEIDKYRQDKVSEYLSSEGPERCMIYEYQASSASKSRLISIKNVLLMFAVIIIVLSLYVFQAKSRTNRF
jgi:hypothetical protein